MIRFITCRTGSLEMSHPRIVKSPLYYLPHRQLRKSTRAGRRAASNYLPHRQLRKNGSPKTPSTTHYLPHRQLRKA